MSKQPRAAILAHSPKGADRYVILTSKPGQFRTELGDQMQTIESYDYLFCGHKKAHFVIARMDQESRIKIVNEVDPSIVNHVPSKFLPRFDTIEQARHELQQLARFGAMDISLVKL